MTTSANLRAQMEAALTTLNSINTPILNSPDKEELEDLHARIGEALKEKFTRVISNFDSGLF